MTPASPSPDLARIGECALAEVFRAYASLPARVHDLADRSRVSIAPEQITSLVSLSGEELSGSVHLQLPLAFVAHAVRHLTGLDGDSADGIAIQADTAGELANMVAGRVAAQLSASGYSCSLGAPSVIRGAALPTTPEPGVDYGRTNLLCAGHSLWLEIQCRYQGP
ncbi:MAG: chemotaxis protein CheX [Verrucomicrobiia bacterium]